MGMVIPKSQSNGIASLVKWRKYHGQRQPIQTEIEEWSRSSCGWGGCLSLGALLEFSIHSRSRFDSALFPGSVDLYFGLACLLNRANFPVFPGRYTRPESLPVPRKKWPWGGPFPPPPKLVFRNFQRDSESIFSLVAQSCHSGSTTQLIPLRLLRVTWPKSEKGEMAELIPPPLGFKLVLEMEQVQSDCSSWLRDKTELLLLPRVLLPVTAPCFAKKKRTFTERVYPKSGL